MSNLRGKKIGFIFLESGYGREPIPLLEALSKELGFELFLIPVAGKEMQNQSSNWLKVRKEKPMLWPAGIYFTEDNIKEWIEEHDRSI